MNMIDSINAMKKGGIGDKDTTRNQGKVIHTLKEKADLTERYKNLSIHDLRLKSLELGFHKTTLLTYRIEISGRKKRWTIKKKHLA